jgi:serine/threonine-protein kinase
MRERDVVWSRWDEVDRLFDRVLEEPAPERRGAVERLCGGDDDLRRALLELLELSGSADDRGTAPGAELLRRVCDPGAAAAPDALKPADRVGRYRIVGVLGQGGMATVYEAERSDGAYRQTVALKVLRRGLDTDRIVARFVAERQILSDFAHPNIARLLDGGATDDGRPFLVMEKVDGEPLTDWADDRRAGVGERLRLFLQVTDAVQEAHRRLVVHRDLKPSNVLVDRGGQVKLLDFGIAKLVDPAAEELDLTRLGPYPLTRRWASPEQVRGEVVTTSSDVYQLGLILYRLLGGAAPFGDEREAPHPARPAPQDAPPRSFEAALDRCDGERLAEIARRRGTTPRALLRSLRGDLDMIVGKALQPDPLDRYRSVEDLATDVRLHLEGRPIRARATPRVVRVKKWLARNRWAPPVAALLTLAVVGYVGTLTLTSRRLEAERNAARAQAERAERIRGFLIDLFQSADPYEGGAAARADVTVADALTDAADRITSELRGEPTMQADLLAAVASIYANLDRFEEGRPMIERALELRRRTGQVGTPTFAEDLQILARVVVTTDLDSAVTLRERAVETLRANVLGSDDPRLADALAGLLDLLVRRTGRSDPAIGEEALAIYEAAGSAYRAEVAGVLSTMAQAYAADRRFDDAETAALESVRRARELLGPDHVSTAVAGAILAGIYDARQRFDDAIPVYLESLRVMERTIGPAHNQTLATRNNLATTLHQVGRLDEAAAIHRELVAAHRLRVGSDNHVSVASSLQNLATALKDLGRLGEADSLAARAYDILVRTTTEGDYLPAFPLLTRTEILLESGDHARAAETAARALVILERNLPAGHFAQGVARCRIGAALLAQGRTAEGEQHVRDALEVLLADERTPVDYLQECQRVQGVSGTESGREH